jgi:ATP sulfurylase
MAKLLELPTDRGICAIPLEHAVYCRECQTVSNSRPHECGLCGSGKVIRLEGILNGNPDPPAKGCHPAKLSLVRAVGA